MLTVISIDELERLYRSTKLEGSITFSFVPQGTTSLLKELYLRKTSDRFGEFLLIKNYEGQDLQDSPDLIKDLDHSIFNLLPTMDKNSVAILVNPKSYALVIGEDSFGRLLNIDSEDDESIQDLRRKISRQRIKDDKLVFAVSSTIRAEEVMRVIYPKHLEEDVRRIANATKARRKTLGATQIFG